MIRGEKRGKEAKKTEEIVNTDLRRAGEQYPHGTHETFSMRGEDWFRGTPTLFASVSTSCKVTNNEITTAIWEWRHSPSLQVKQRDAYLRESMPHGIKTQATQLCLQLLSILEEKDKRARETRKREENTFSVPKGEENP